MPRVCVKISDGETFGADDNGLMAKLSPRPLTLAELRARRSHVARLARGLRFVGRIEYRHAYSQTGGAQCGRGSTADEDLLTVYAEAFERDADPEDFCRLGVFKNCGISWRHFCDRTQKAQYRPSGTATRVGRDRRVSDPLAGSTHDRPGAPAAEESEVLRSLRRFLEEPRRRRRRNQRAGARK
jgi:hypothetical protein